MALLLLLRLGMDSYDGVEGADTRDLLFRIPQAVTDAVLEKVRKMSGGMLNGG